jgi:hypothetical protein
LKKSSAENPARFKFSAASEASLLARAVYFPVAEIAWIHP